MNYKKAIVGLVSNPAKSLNSHNGGWTLVLKNIFKADVLTEKGDWFFSVAGNAKKPIIDKSLINYYREWNDLKDFL